jgi:hypothetical protein
MWPPISAYGGQTFQFWTRASSGAWTAFDNAARQYGTPTDVWIMLCIFQTQGLITQEDATPEDLRQIIANTRSHAPGARIHITGQPLYTSGWTCGLVGSAGPELSDQRAQEAANDPSLDVRYAGTFLLDGNASPSEIASDSCHASSAGELSLGNQAVAKWGP